MEASHARRTQCAICCDNERRWNFKFNWRVCDMIHIEAHESRSSQSPRNISSALLCAFPWRVAMTNSQRLHSWPWWCHNVLSVDQYINTRALRSELYIPPWITSHIGLSLARTCNSLTFFQSYLCCTICSLLLSIYRFSSCCLFFTLSESSLKAAMSNE